MKLFKAGVFVLFAITCLSVVRADEEELIEGSKHIISLDLEARFDVKSSGNEISPRDSGSGSGFDFRYQYLFGLGININADHAAPLFLYLQKPSFIGASIAINSDKFDGRSERASSPFRLDSSSNAYDINIFGQNYFKSGFGITYKLRDVITEGARFQIFDNSVAGDTGLEKLDQNELFLDIALNKYFVSDRLLTGLDLGMSSVTGKKPFFTGKKDDANDLSGTSYNVGFHVDYLTNSEKFLFGMTYNFLTLNLDTDVVFNVGGRVTGAPADYKYNVNRDETIHFVEFRLKHIMKNSVALNYKFALRQTHDALDNQLSSSTNPTVNGRDITEYRLTVSPEFWIFNRMKVAFLTGISSYSLSEDTEAPVNVGGSIVKADHREIDYISWFVGMNLEILF